MWKPRVARFGALPLQRMQLPYRKSHEKFRIRLGWDVYFLERSEPGLLICAYRRKVLHRWPDDAHVDAVEWERNVAQELTEHRRPVTVTNQVGLADEEVDPDGVLAERERRGVLRRVRDPVVLKYPGASSIDPLAIAVRRVLAAYRQSVPADSGIRV